MLGFDPNTSSHAEPAIFIKNTYWLTTIINNISIMKTQQHATIFECSQTEPHLIDVPDIVLICKEDNVPRNQLARSAKILSISNVCVIIKNTKLFWITKAEVLYDFTRPIT